MDNTCDYTAEASNEEIGSILSDIKDEFKRSNSEFKRYMRKREYSKAIAIAKDLEKIIDNAEKEIDNMTTDIFSASIPAIKSFVTTTAVCLLATATVSTQTYKKADSYSKKADESRAAAKNNEVNITASKLLMGMDIDHAKAYRKMAKEKRDIINKAKKSYNNAGYSYEYINELEKGVKKFDKEKENGLKSAEEKRLDIHFNKRKMKSNLKHAEYFDNKSEDTKKKAKSLYDLGKKASVLIGVINTLRSIISAYKNEGTLNLSKAKVKSTLKDLKESASLMRRRAEMLSKMKK